MPEKRELPSVVATLGWLVTAGVVVIPLLVAPDFLDRFRVVKESAARAEGFLGLFLVVVAIAFGSADRLREMLRERAVAAVLIAGVAWSGITTLTSTHRALSVESFITILTSALIFFVSWYAAPRVPLLVFDLLVPVVLINAVLAAMQEYGIYNPFTSFAPYRHLSATGLIGNPNIVGTYMSLAVIVFAAAASSVPGWRRYLYTFGALCAAASVVVSRTRTALIALMVAIVIFAVGRSLKRAAVVAAALAVLFAIGFAAGVPVVRRLAAVPKRVAANGLEVATSGRMGPNLAALQMFRDHPVTGMGPGTFKYHYMQYHATTWLRYKSLLRGTSATSFSEAHNDHLQVLAEAGLPGYALFLAAIGILVFHARRADADDPRARIARTMVIPLATLLLLLCLAQFPLHVAVTRQLLVTLAGLVAGWSRP